MDYEIDPMSAASPDLDDAEFAALKQSIADLGQLVSIVIAGGKIIDGRKRYRACMELGKTPAVIELPLGVDPTTHAVALNLLRTQYTASQRAMYAAAVATRTHGQNPGRYIGSTTLENLPPTTRQAAAAAGVSVGQLGVAKVVRKRGIPEVVSAVERGDLTVHGAKAIVEVVPKHEQAAALERALATPKARDGRRQVAPRLSSGNAPRLHRRAKAELADKAIGVLAHAADELSAIIDDLTDFSQAERWLAQLDNVAATVRRARNLLKEQANGDSSH